MALSLVTVLLLVGVDRSGSVRSVQAADVTAFATIRDSNGQIIGMASFVESGAADVKVTVEVSGLTPGLHGMHVHTVGKCDGPEFVTAGGHFNPRNVKHGLQTSDGPHSGDLPNLVVGSDGKARFSMTVSRFTLSVGSLSLMDADGSAVVVHALPDDGMTDATGNSGGRVACGVVTLGAAPVAAPQVPASPVSAISPPSTGDSGLATSLVFSDERELH